MNKFMVISTVIGCVLYHAQLSFGLRCYNCTSTKDANCVANLTEHFAIDCDRSVSTCYFAVADSSLRLNYEIQRGCGKLNQESNFEVDYVVYVVPLYHIETCKSDLCNRQIKNETANPNVTDISCYNCSTLIQPLCRNKSHLYSTMCPHIQDISKGHCYKLEFTYNDRPELQLGCGVFFKNDTIISVPNKFEAHIDHLKTCTRSLCNFGVRVSASNIFMILSIIFGSKYISQFM